MTASIAEDETWYRVCPHHRRGGKEQIAACHSSYGGECGERIDPVKYAKHRVHRREQGSRT